MADVKLKYAAATAITITLNSLGSGSEATSSAVDNSSNLYEDYLVEVLLVASGATSGNQQAIIYAVDSIDATNFSDSGVDANMRIIGYVSLPDTAARRSSAFSIAAAFGGVCPPEFKIVVKNDCGVGLAGSGNSAQQVGVYHTVV